MQNQDPGRLAKIQAAQNSAEMARIRLSGGCEIPAAQIPSEEDLLAAKGALYRAIRIVRSLLGIGGVKGGA